MIASFSLVTVMTLLVTQKKKDIGLLLALGFTPERLQHVDDAARLLADAIAAGERMLIVADYDADGATACAVGVRALRARSS